jgi:adenylate kinase
LTENAGDGRPSSIATGLAHISTGEVLRRHVREQTPLGVSVATTLAKGELAPDDVVTEIVREVIDALPPPAGYVLDGFPRTVGQARAIAAAERAPQLAVLLKVPDDELMQRLERRSVEAAAVGARRPDDTSQTSRRRIEVFAHLTAPLIDYYQVRNALLSIDGVGSTDDVYDGLIAGLRARFDRDRTTGSGVEI